MKKKNENIKEQTYTDLKTFSDASAQQQTNESGLGSLFSILPSTADINSMDEQQQPKPKKKKKKRRPRLS